MSKKDRSWLSTSSRDRFEIRKLLGAGGMGSVFLARDRSRRHDVALKTLSQLDGTNIYKLKQEFRSLANIVHENLVTLYELLVLDDRWFFTMKHVDGVSFLEYVRPYLHLLPPDVTQLDTGLGSLSIAEPLPLSEVLSSTSDHVLMADLMEDETCVEPQFRPEVENRLSEIRKAAIKSAKVDFKKLLWTLPQLATGLHALHQAGKLHRDIKPNNILVNHEGQVFLCDFGLVVDTRDTKNKGKKEGTPAYMSPEQILGNQISPASDWYSFGLVLYEALTGELPFSALGREAFKTRCRQDAPSPSSTGAEVPSDLDRLCTALLKKDPNQRPSPEEVLEALGVNELAHELSLSAEQQAGQTAFVGRHKQLQHLMEAYDFVSKGHNVAAMVHGRSGIGKSLLIEHFLKQIGQNEEVLIFCGRCYERESVPYKALDSLIDSLSNTLLEFPADRLEQILPRDMPALARLFPSMQRLSEDLADTTCEVQDAQELRHRAFVALRYLLRMLAVDRPTVIYIDDLQWGDMDSAPFLVDLVHHPQAPPLLLIASYRTDEVEQSPLIQSMLNTGTGIRGDIRDIPLQPLEEEEAQELAVQLMGDGIADQQEVAKSIVHQASGNPMFINELALSVREFGQVGKNLQLDEIIAERIKALPEDARALVTASSVAARPLPVQILSQASELEGEASALATLQAKRLIRTRRVAGIEEMETYHDRIRESTVAHLSSEQLTQYNRKLAETLEDWGQAEPIALVQFWQKAGNDEKAGHYAVLAAHDAAQSLAFDRAAHLYKAALDLKTNLTDEERLALLESRADVLANGGALVEAAEDFQEAARYADRFVAVNLQRKALEQLLRTGTLSMDAQLANTVLKAVGMKAPSGRVKALLNFLWQRLLLRKRGYEFTPRAEKDIDPALLQKIDVCWSVSSALPFVQPVYGFIVQTQMNRFALDAGDPYRVAVVLSQEMSFLSTHGSKKEAKVRELIDMSHKVAYYSENPTAIAFAKASAAFAYFLLGDFESSLINASRIEQELRQLGTLRWAVSISNIFRMSAMLYVGKLRQLTQEMPVVLKEATERGDRYLTDGLRKWRTNVLWLVLDDPDEAQRQAGEYSAGNVRGTNFQLDHYYETNTHAQILIYRGDGRGAWVMMEDAQRRMKMALIKNVQSVRIEGAFTVARCALAAAVEDPKKRKQLLAEVARCIKRLNKEPIPWSKALSALVSASYAAMQGRREQAAELFHEAEASLQAANLRLFATVARLRRGTLLGGEQGSELIQQATDWLKREAVRNPDRLVALYAPDHRLSVD